MSNIKIWPLSANMKLLLGLVTVIAGYAIYLQMKNTQLEKDRAWEQNKSEAGRFLALTPEQRSNEIRYNSRVNAAAKLAKSVDKIEKHPSEYFDLKSAVLRDSGAVCMDYVMTDKDTQKSHPRSILLTPNSEVYLLGTSAREPNENAWEKWCRPPSAKDIELEGDVNYTKIFGDDYDWRVVPTP